MAADTCRAHKACTRVRAAGSGHEFIERRRVWEARLSSAFISADFSSPGSGRKKEPLRRRSRYFSFRDASRYACLHTGREKRGAGEADNGSDGKRWESRVWETLLRLRRTALRCLRWVVEISARILLGLLSC